jgi:hypothetical protein
MVRLSISSQKWGKKGDFCVLCMKYIKGETSFPLILTESIALISKHILDWQFRL